MHKIASELATSSAVTVEIIGQKRYDETSPLYFCYHLLSLES